ncbi:MAG TPA: AAA family ATPase [Thermoanaerobaculia bacterium]|nr:AAA family ATPase [Thermoanaerobaculia bacterium]
MLTRLRVQGFKNLLDLDIRFGPFNCVAGPNGAGKSNLFDAIHFLSLLTQYSIMESVRLLRETRGKAPNPRSLFTTFGDFRSPEMRFTTDLIVDRAVQDQFGSPAKASISTLRYEVAFRLAKDDGVERLELAAESLVPLTQERARHDLGFPARPAFKDSVIEGRRSAPFISTSGTSIPEIKVHQEGHDGRTFCRRPIHRSARRQRACRHRTAAQAGTPKRRGLQRAVQSPRRVDRGCPGAKGERRRENGDPYARGDWP